jgi:Rrf2 family protein
MKLSAQEEYGLRCLLHLARRGPGESVTIPEISAAEGLSVPNVAKLMRMLRMSGIVHSVRGQAGGYTLSKLPEQIPVSEALIVLGGQFFGPRFCDRHSGLQSTCSHLTDCSMRALWTGIQFVLQEVLGKTTLEDLLRDESEMETCIAQRTQAAMPLLNQIRNGPRARAT